MLIAQHFLPLNVVASQRAVRMARVLLERFERVYVVCGDIGAVDQALLDREYGRDVVEHPRLVRLTARAQLSGYGYGAATSRLQRLAGAAATRLLCGPGVDWVRPLGRALASIDQADVVRLVLATGPPFITFAAAERFAAARRAPIVLDFRDLWTGNPHAPYPAPAKALVSRWIERPAIRAATLITTVSEGCRSSLRSGGAPVPVSVLYNTPDSAYVRYYRDAVDAWRRRGVSATDRARSATRFVFAGQVYRNCTFAPVLKAAATLAPSVLDRIEVHYYGDSSLVARAEFQQFGLSRILTDHGKVAKHESLQAMLDGDVLVSLIHTDRRSSDPAVTGHLSTKIYDYLLSGVPILNIGPVNAEVNALAAGIGYRGFHSFPADDTGGIARFLEEAVGRRVARAEPLSVALPAFDAALSDLLAGVVPE